MAKKRKPKAGKTSSPWPDRLWKIRERLNLTQAEAAFRLGVSLRAYADWERGHRKPLRAHLPAIERLEKSKK